MKSKQVLPLCMLAILVLATLPASPDTKRQPTGEVGTRIPPVLFAQLPDWPVDYPVWVSADAAIKPDGSVNRELVPEAFAGSLYQWLNDPQLRRGDCIHLEEVWNDRINPPDRSTLAKAVATADAVLRGTVVDRDYGFQATAAGQLVTVRVDEALKGERVLDEYYVFIPVGRFQAGPYKICKTDQRIAGEPRLGDQVLLMPAAVADMAEPYLHLAEPEALLMLKTDTGVRLPESLRAATPATERVQREQLLDTIRGLIHSPSGKE